MLEKTPLHPVFYIFDWIAMVCRLVMLTLVWLKDPWLAIFLKRYTVFEKRTLYWFIGNGWLMNFMIFSLTTWQILQYSPATNWCILQYFSLLIVFRDFFFDRLTNFTFFSHEQVMNFAIFFNFFFYIDGWLLPYFLADDRIL